MLSPADLPNDIAALKALLLAQDEVVEGGVNLRSNSKMEELFGYAPGEINGLSVLREISQLLPNESLLYVADCV